MNLNRDPYQKIAKYYDLLIEPLNRSLIAVAMKTFPFKAGMFVLDVGCGTGTHLDLYQKIGCKVFGIDLSPAMLDVARQKLGDRAELHLGDASQMPYSDGTFDLVVTFLTLHEMPALLRSAVMKELKRVMKKDGRILLIDYRPGPIRFLKGWFIKAVIIFFEIAAGREHFKNYRDFISCEGLPTLITAHQLSIDRKKIVNGGNIGLFLLRLQ